MRGQGSEVHTCGRAWAGVPSRTVSLLPRKMAAHWSQWAPSPWWGGAGSEEATVASSIASERKAQSDGLRSQTIARTFFNCPAKVNEVCSARCEHHKDLRISHAAPRIVERAHLSGWL